MLLFERNKCIELMAPATLTESDLAGWLEIELSVSQQRARRVLGGQAVCLLRNFGTPAECTGPAGWPSKNVPFMVIMSFENVKTKFKLPCPLPQSEERASLHRHQDSLRPLPPHAPGSRVNMRAGSTSRICTERQSPTLSKDTLAHLLVNDNVIVCTRSARCYVV